MIQSDRRSRPYNMVHKVGFERSIKYDTNEREISRGKKKCHNDKMRVQIQTLFVQYLEAYVTKSMPELVPFVDEFKVELEKYNESLKTKVGCLFQKSKYKAKNFTGLYQDWQKFLQKNNMRDSLEKMEADESFMKRMSFLRGLSNTI